LQGFNHLEKEMFLFEIIGPLMVQQQTRWGKGRFYDASAKDKQKIQWQVKPFAPATPFCGPVEMTLVFFFPIPKKTSKIQTEQMLNRMILPDKPPDEDNLAYLVTNALKGIVYDDDKRICAKHVYKFYGPEAKTVIKVRPIEQSQPIGYRNADDL
jgi:Holliday junction resolvase RusA-like endonuclease